MELPYEMDESDDRKILINPLKMTNLGAWLSFFWPINAWSVDTMNSVYMKAFIFLPTNPKAQAKLSARLAWKLSFTLIGSHAPSSTLNVLNISWESMRIFSRLAQINDSWWELT